MNRFGSICSVDEQIRKLERNLPRLDGQVELLTKIHLSDPTSFFQAQALPGPREKNIDAD